MKHLLYNPFRDGSAPVIAFFISGSGTNYEKIARVRSYPKYVVFTNRPECEGARKATAAGHQVIVLSHHEYLSGTKEKYGLGKVPRNCPERVEFEKHVSRLLEEACGGQPDLICLAGYDQWVTDWLVERYYPRILNVHPGDTIKGYDGLHWIPSAKAIIAGDKCVKSTLFLVDKGEDTGPVLLQSSPLNIAETLKTLDANHGSELLQALEDVTTFITTNEIDSYSKFAKQSGTLEKHQLKTICQAIQDELKVQGDWEIYPFGVHELIMKGRVEVSGRDIYVDGIKQLASGYNHIF